MIQLDSSGRSLAADERFVDCCAVMRQAWRFAHEDAVAAYGRWSCAPRGLRGDVYCAYVAAADHEAAAAKLLGTVAARGEAR